MMREYIVYYCGKIIGGIYDNRLLIKPTPSALELMPDATYELPYKDAKEMLLVDDVDNKEYLAKLLTLSIRNSLCPIKRNTMWKNLYNEEKKVQNSRTISAFIEDDCYE